MPELPEVETVRQILRSEIIGKNIQGIEIYKPKDEAKKRISLVKEIGEEEFINLLIGKTIQEIDRKGKCLFFILGTHTSDTQDVQNTHVLISRLGMTGKYFIEEKLLEENLPTKEQKDLFEKHSTEESKVLTFHLGDGQKTIKLTYCDSRRFGSFRLQTFKDYKHLEPYKNIGTDLLKKVDTKLLFEHYQKRKVPIKNALLEQKVISGIGNIYASEILFDTKIHPLKKTNQLTCLEVEKIISSAQNILKEALKLKGTSEFDFVNPLSKEGSYQERLKVYNRAGKPCPNNCGSLIEKIKKEEKEINKGKINEKKPKERSTFFCPQCQKLEL